MPTITIRHDTRAWKMQVWISFLLAAILCAIGLTWLPGRDLDRAFMVMGYGFCLSAVFALSKFIATTPHTRSTRPSGASSSGPASRSRWH